MEPRRRPDYRLEHLRGERRQDSGRHLGGGAHGPADCALYPMVSVSGAGKVILTSPTLHQPMTNEARSAAIKGPNRARDEFHLDATAQNLRKLAMLIPVRVPTSAI